MKPIFSLLCPTRERTQYLERLLGTISDTVNNCDNIEILFAYDEDDIITEAYLWRCKRRFSFPIRLFKRERSDFLNRDYYNILAKEAIGEFCWLIGDDLLFIKRDWDIYLINEINSYFSTHISRAVYINAKDDTPKPFSELPDYANFPIISKEAIDTIGFFMPPEIPSWSGDFLVYLIYCHEKSNRILNIKEPLLQHFSTYTGKVETEVFSNRHRMLHQKYKVDDFIPVWQEKTLPVLRGKLLTHIQTYRRKDNELIPIFQGR